MMKDKLPNGARELRSKIGSTALGRLDWFSVFAWGLAALVGALQARRLNAGWLMAYGGDVFGPAALWWTVRRTVFARMHRGAELAGGTVLVACIVWEICQRFDLSDTILHITRGTYDALDLLAYTLTVGSGYTAEKWLQHRKAKSGERLVQRRLQGTSSGLT